MTKRYRFLLLFCFLCQFILGQKDTIVLSEVVISDLQLKKFSNSKSVLQLNDSVIAKNRASLTSLLNYNSTLYFKENGLGMVSSPSFRGTTAQQTAVIWNGININSQLNGQTDFNTITSFGYNSVTVRAGGGSSIYGSSAIGGSIHLNNTLNFQNEFSNNLHLQYGSFDTFNLDYAVKIATKKVSSQFLFSRNSSENNYKYLNTNKYNENGQFQTTSFNFNFGYKINAVNFLKLYSQFFDGDRNFSGTLAAPSKSNYLDVNTRNLLEFSSYFKNGISNFRVAFLSESYKYFEDKEQPNFSFGKSETAIVKHDLTYKVTPRISINSVLDFTNTKGFGSDFGDNTRHIFSAVLLMKHQITNRFLYELNVRKEVTTNYKSPILYALGTNFNVTKNYTVKCNFSKNFRIPTFNDLYWNVGGNQNLKPESAYQFDFIQELNFKNTVFSVAAFYNKITDLISWQPNSNGFWQPTNTNKVQTYGVETSMKYNARMSKSHNLKLHLNYGYTVSENEITKKQLLYVPYHKVTSNLAYSYKKATLFCSYLFNGTVFTSLDNTYKLKEYSVVNAGFDYRIVPFCSLGFQVKNAFNESYQVVAQRPFPGRNYTVNLNFKL